MTAALTIYFGMDCIYIYRYPWLSAWRLRKFLKFIRKLDKVEAFSNFGEFL